MSTPTKTPGRKAPAVAAPAYPLADSKREANRLIDEAALLRYAIFLRLRKIRGPLEFGAPKPVVADVRDFSELIPKFLKKPLQGWAITADGFAYSLAVRPDEAAIAKAINARSDELGVYLCKKGSAGWQFLVEF